jgi:elongation factor G
MASVDPNKIRNVGFLGHGGSGKTMLIEHILNDAGATQRVGTIAEGNTVGDYLEEEKEREQTICMKLMHCDWHGTRIHMVDHPGYVDFLGEVASSIGSLDAAVILVDATTGVQVGTDHAMSYCDANTTPRAIFVSKTDRDNTDYHAVVDALKETYGNHCVPLVIPIGEGSNLSGCVNIMKGDNPDVHDEVMELRTSITDVVAESNDELLEKFLDSGELSEEDFNRGMHEGIRAGKIVPIIVGSVELDIGVKELMDVIEELFPTPLERTIVGRNAKEEDVTMEASADGPFIGQVFRTLVDPFVGQLTLIRVLSGTLQTDSDFYNVTTNSKERTGKLHFLCGKEQSNVAAAGPGDLIALAKLKHTNFGDTVASAGTDIIFPKPAMPEAMVKLAIEPKSKADEDKIGEALHRIADEDPTFTHYRDPDTKEHVVRGLGDLQLEILLDRMHRKYHVEAQTRTPKVAIKETVKGKSDVKGKHKKQSGGHGQYGDVSLRISPSQRGAGYKFIDSVVGGVVPRQYIPHVDKGCQEALDRGVIAGYPVVDVTVELHFGSYHDVDSSEMAFKVAAAQAIKKGVVEARPCLLEPVMEIEITIPDEVMGDVNGDLNSRRGRIMGMETAGPGRQCIKAQVPEAEVLRYSTDLRSMTGGRGSYTMKFSHYDEVPEHVAQDIIAAYEAEKVAAD